MLNKITVTLVFAILPVFLIAQDDGILPNQLTNIRRLAYSNGFNENTLAAYVHQVYGESINDLSQEEGANLIRSFLYDNKPKPLTTEVTGGSMWAPVKEFLSERNDSDVKPVRREPEVRPEPIAEPDPEPEIAPIIASILEVGMEKRFHLLDGNIIQGTIIKKEDGICHIETIDGILRVPDDAILEETAHLVKKDDTRYVGPVLKETPEEIVIRSSYGDVVIAKRDIKSMDRFHGGKKAPKTEIRKTFHSGAEILTDIFMDPTAFPLEVNTFYISGLSIGYGFTDKFMIRSSFGNDFKGDLNLHPMFQFYHRQTGTSEVAAATGIRMYNHHSMVPVVAKYAKYLDSNEGGLTLQDADDITLDTLLNANNRIQFYWDWYIVLSSRKSMPTGRGKVGWHAGFMTNSLALDKPVVAGYTWNSSFVMPYRLWAAFEYDLSKRLKLEAVMWADNGHKFRTIREAAEDYIFDSTPTILDSRKGTYRPVDFDFGFLYAMSETFRVGMHFQEPYLVFYWEFYEL